MDSAIALTWGDPADYSELATQHEIDEYDMWLDEQNSSAKRMRTALHISEASFSAWMRALKVFAAYSRMPGYEFDNGHITMVYGSLPKTQMYLVHAWLEGTCVCFNYTDRKVPHLEWAVRVWPHRIDASVRDAIPF